MGAACCIKIARLWGLQVLLKFFRYVCLAAIAIAAAFFVAITLANPAAADPSGGGGGRITTKPWDTDNLVYTQGTASYSAENFRVPFHQYRGYSTAAGASPAAREACAPGGIADAFFQTDSGRGRNDFPVLKQTGTTWAETATGTKNTGCAKFVDAQLTMAARARNNGGYYLDSQGNLSRTDDMSAARFLAAPAARTRTYGTWSASRSVRTGYQSLTRASSSDSAIPASAKTYGILAHTANGASCRSRTGGLARASGEAMKTRPLLQFVADWNNFPDRRDSMLSGSLPEDCDENYAAAIAAVVHGLCSRDDYLMPAGLANRKASEDILISLDTADSEYGKRIRSGAVDVCWQHRVFFTADTLDKR